MLAFFNIGGKMRVDNHNDRGLYIVMDRQPKFIIEEES